MSIRPERSGPGALAGATEAGDIAERRSDPRSTFASPEPIAPDASKRMRLLAWWPMPRKTLRGFCVVELPAGLIIRDIGIHEKGGRWWASLPVRPVLNGDGRHVANHAGHKQYAALLGWRDRNLADRFSAAVVEVVRLAHPSALDDRGEP